MGPTRASALQAGAGIADFRFQIAEFRLVIAEAESMSTQSRGHGTRRRACPRRAVDMAPGTRQSSDWRFQNRRAGEEGEIADPQEMGHAAVVEDGNLVLWR
jgi:hypothetical protein